MPGGAPAGVLAEAGRRRALLEDESLPLAELSVATIGVSVALEAEVPGSLSRAGKVQGQTPRSRSGTSRGPAAPGTGRPRGRVLCRQEARPPRAQGSLGGSEAAGGGARGEVPFSDSLIQRPRSFVFKV